MKKFFFTTSEFEKQNAERKEKYANIQSVLGKIARERQNRINAQMIW